MRMKESFADKVFDIINLLIMLIVLLIVIYPLFYIAIASFSDPVLVNAGKVLLLPQGFTLEGYQRVIRHQELWLGYGNSIFYTIAGTALSLVLTLPCAFALANKNMVGRNAIMLLFTLTMMFSGGLIPTYIVVKNLGMPNTIWALIVPGALSVYNLIVSRTYMQRSIPLELQESAYIDGASTTRVFMKVVLPLSTPIIAVLALFYGIAKWNDYFTALIYVSKRNLVPLQIVLREILVQTNMASSSDAGSVETMAQQARISELMKYCVIVAASLPAMIAYPFVQKYFVQGIMLGALKG